MECALRALTLFAFSAALSAQSPAGNPPAAGLETPWEMAPVLQELSAHAARLLPALEKVNPRAWIEKGASDTYVAQRQSALEQTRAVEAEAKALAASPERLSAGLQLLFRVQALDSMLGSLSDGVRRYQAPRDAQELAKLAAESGAGRDRLQRYLVNLASQREKDYEVMDREAQRCRGIVTQAPPRTRKN
jgi:hypothetical protein